MLIIFLGLMPYGLLDLFHRAMLVGSLRSPTTWATLNQIAGNSFLNLICSTRFQVWVYFVVFTKKSKEKEP